MSRFRSSSPDALGEGTSFTSLSEGGRPPLSHEWDFGDGSPVSIEPEPTYLYPAAGSYTVSLTVSDAAARSDTTVREVHVTAARPLATGPLTIARAGDDAQLH